MKLSISGNALFLVLNSLHLYHILYFAVCASFPGFLRIVVSSRNAKTSVLSFPLVKDNSNSLDYFLVLF